MPEITELHNNEARKPDKSDRTLTHDMVSHDIVSHDIVAQIPHEKNS